VKGRSISGVGVLAAGLPFKAGHATFADGESMASAGSAIGPQKLPDV
jgi:hypothetical protein